MMCDAAVLIQRKREKDTQDVRKEVLGEISSIGQKEFFTAGQNGMKPEFMIKLWDADYSGERVIEVGGVRYAIYRPFRIGNFVNLYCEKRTGVR